MACVMAFYIHLGLSSDTVFDEIPDTFATYGIQSPCTFLEILENMQVGKGYLDFVREAPEGDWTDRRAFMYNYILYGYN